MLQALKNLSVPGIEQVSEINSNRNFNYLPR